MSLSSARTSDDMSEPQRSVLRRVAASGHKGVPLVEFIFDDQDTDSALALHHHRLITRFRDRWFLTAQGRSALGN